MFDLTNKTAAITGSASGIGRAIAMLFAKQGASIHIIDFNLAAAELVVAEITALGGSAFAHAADVSDQNLMVNIFERIGKLDILVNNAGIAHVGTIETTSSADFDKVFRVNVQGAYNAMFAAIPAIKSNGKGVILNLASIAALIGIPDRFAYSMSKGAIVAMTMSVARDYLNQNIRCNSISPARVHTPFVDGFIAKNYPGKETEMFEKLSKSQPIGRMGSVDDIAALALYLCSDESSFITGNDYPIDGGFIHLNN
ncbi:MAG: glucose 1-dehydrogenase [Bacteroidetes bacterium]|nr:glucose 1-dehydrogenase [Bacteroidota bacterium]